MLEDLYDISFAPIGQLSIKYKYKSRGERAPPAEPNNNTCTLMRKELPHS